MKKKKATPVFSCKTNGEMYDVIDGVLYPKKVKKLHYKSTKNKSKQNGRNNL